MVNLAFEPRTNRSRVLPINLVDPGYFWPSWSKISFIKLILFIFFFILFLSSCNINVIELNKIWQWETGLKVQKMSSSFRSRRCLQPFRNVNYPSYHTLTGIAIQKPISVETLRLLFTLTFPSLSSSSALRFCQSVFLVLVPSLSPSPSAIFPSAPELPLCSYAETISLNPSCEDSSMSQVTEAGYQCPSSISHHFHSLRVIVVSLCHYWTALCRMKWSPPRCESGPGSVAFVWSIFSGQSPLALLAQLRT